MANSVELGNYKSLRCPKCGGEVTTVYDDYDWWDAICDECSYEFAFNPGKYIAFEAVQLDWVKQYAEEVANAD